MWQTLSVKFSFSNRKIKSIKHKTKEHITLENYNHSKSLKGKMQHKMKIFHIIISVLTSFMHETFWSIHQVTAQQNCLKDYRQDFKEKCSFAPHSSASSAPHSLILNSSLSPQCPHNGSHQMSVSEHIISPSLCLPVFFMKTHLP